jgi:flagellar biosynthetic protein FliP
MAVVAAVLMWGTVAVAQEAPPPEGLALPSLEINVGRAETPEDVTTMLNLFVIITVLSIAPAILVLMTSFTRIIVVLGFMRQALATQQMPPNQVLVGLALFLTVFVMAPVWQRVYVEAYQPYSAGELRDREAFDTAMAPLREFMLRQTREKDLMLFVRLSKMERPATYEDIPTYVVVPAYVISELRTAFEIGFMIYVPFLIIDMVVASTLMAMGMLMLPPIFISLPFKIVMFVLADGWYRLVGSLVESFH